VSRSSSIHRSRRSRLRQTPAAQKRRITPLQTRSGVPHAAQGTAARPWKKPAKLSAGDDGKNHAGRWRPTPSAALPTAGKEAAPRIGRRNRTIPNPATGKVQLRTR
jgi:hypothetical protein